MDDVIGFQETGIDAIGLWRPKLTEFGEEAANVILAILAREAFDLVVMGEDQGERRVAENVARTSPCKVVLKAA